jgi:hypothetical protein
MESGRFADPEDIVTAIEAGIERNVKIRVVRRICGWDQSAAPTPRLRGERGAAQLREASGPLLPKRFC